MTYNFQRLHPHFRGRAIQLNYCEHEEEVIRCDAIQSRIKQCRLLCPSDVAVRPSSAANTLCINADNFIDRLFVNGIDVTSSLVNARAVRGCDCIQLPVNTKTIAVQASNIGKQAGLQSCRTESVAVFDGWRCVDARKVNPTISHRKCIVSK